MWFRYWLQEILRWTLGWPCPPCMIIRFMVLLACYIIYLVFLLTIQTL